MQRAISFLVAGLSIVLVAACTGGATASPAAPSVGGAASGGAASPSPSPSPSASGPTTVAMGTFHRVTADASGTAALEHLADGSFAVVFEDFSTGSAQHTNVYLVAAADVTKDADVDPAKAVDLGPLTGTTGMQDYKVPADMAANAMTYHTVVLWDTEMKHAVAAAPLK